MICGVVEDRDEMDWGSVIPPEKFHVIDGFDTTTVAYTSDIPVLSNWGTPLLFGPGSIHHAHTDHEHVSVDELRQSVDAYVQIARTLLAS